MTAPSYKNVLAVDSATAILRLGLSFGHDRRVTSSNPAERSHGQMIIKKIDELLGSAGLQKNDLDAIVVSLGPGSFTGLRIGLAAVKGLAVALGIPVVGINLFELAAYKLRHTPEPVVLLIPLMRDKVFAAEIGQGTYDADAISVAAVAKLPEIVAGKRVALIGIDPGMIPSGSDPAPRVEVLDYDAADLLELGLAKLSAGVVGEVARLEPMYVQKSQAEIRFEERRKRQ